MEIKTLLHINIQQIGGVIVSYVLLNDQSAAKPLPKSVVIFTIK